MKMMVQSLGGTEIDNEDIKIAVEYWKSELKYEIERTKNCFTLNPKIKEIKETIAKLQEMCDHDYKDGYCIWCGKKEDE